MFAFISHSSKDNEIAVELQRLVETISPISIFLDVDPDDGIPAGELFVTYLQEKQTSSNLFFYLISQNWLNSDWCRAEFKAAQLTRANIVPILVDDKLKEYLPAEVTSVQYISWSDSHRTSQIKRILNETTITKSGRSRIEDDSINRFHRDISFFREHAKSCFRSSKLTVTETFIQTNGLVDFVLSKTEFGIKQQFAAVLCVPKLDEPECLAHFKWLQDHVSNSVKSLQCKTIIVLSENDVTSFFNQQIDKNINFVFRTIATIDRESLRIDEYIKGADQKYRSPSISSVIDLDYSVLSHGGTKSETQQNLIEHIYNSVLERRNLFFFLLGEYGTGKTTIAESLHKRFCRNYIDDHGAPVPIILYLRTFSEFGSSEKFLENQIQQIFPSVSDDFFERLQDHSEVIFILDGFDEIETYSTEKQRYQYFLDLFNLASKAKYVILTSRPTIFRNFNEFENLLSSIGAVNSPAGILHEKRQQHSNEAKKLAQKKNRIALRKINANTATAHFSTGDSTVLQIEALNKDQIIKFFDRYSDRIIYKHKKTPKEVYDALIDVYDLTDILTRPLLLEMFLKVLLDGDIDLNDPDLLVGPNSLYLEYIEINLDREGKRSSILDAETRWKFSRAAAIAMLKAGGVLETGLEAILPVVKENLDLFEFMSVESINRNSEQLFTDLRVCGFLKILDNGRITFSHKSFMEFFIAETIFIKMKNHQVVEEMIGVLSYEILQFVGGFGIAVEEARPIVLNHDETLAEVPSQNYASNLAIAKIFAERNSSNKEFNDISFNIVKFAKRAFDRCKFSNLDLRSCTYNLVAFSACTFDSVAIEGFFFKTQFLKSRGSIRLDAGIEDCVFNTCELAITGRAEFEKVEILTCEFSSKIGTLSIRNSLISNSVIQILDNGFLKLENATVKDAMVFDEGAILDIESDIEKSILESVSVDQATEVENCLVVVSIGPPRDRLNINFASSKNLTASSVAEQENKTINQEVDYNIKSMEKFFGVVIIDDLKIDHKLFQFKQKDRISYRGWTRREGIVYIGRRWLRKVKLPLRDLYYSYKEDKEEVKQAERIFEDWINQNKAIFEAGSL